MSERLTKGQVVTLMEWSGVSSVDVALHRTRHPQDFPGSTRFPEPDADGLWDRAAVLRYKDNRSAKGRGLSEAERQRIVAMHERGVPAWEIADRVGCRSGSVYRILHRMRDGR
jgi:DNA-directed RNA polymerase specialized sigma24 family protein